MTYEYCFGGRSARRGKGTHVQRQLNDDSQEEGFICCHCQTIVESTPYMGTAHRNHCNRCLWSRHADTAPGDRASNCKGCMKPIGITFKRNGRGRTRKGDIMLIHQCTGCGEVNINRIAGDDCPAAILDVFVTSGVLPAHLKTRLATQDIHLLQPGDEEYLRAGLFGKQSDTM